MIRLLVDAYPKWSHHCTHLESWAKNLEDQTIIYFSIRTFINMYMHD